MPPERRDLLLYLPGFIDDLKKEVIYEDSQIWDSNFKPPIGLTMKQKRDREQLSANIVPKKPTDVKRLKCDDLDTVTDEMVIEAIEHIGDPTYANKNEIVFPVNAPRDEGAKTEESRQEIEFRIVGNSLTQSVSQNTMKWLLGLQSVFAHQLPDMPRDYIAHLVFDSCVFSLQSLFYESDMVLIVRLFCYLGNTKRWLS